MAAITTDCAGSATQPLNSLLRRKRATTAMYSRAPATSTAVYYYRESNGSHGTAVDAGDIPSGAVVEFYG